MSCGLTPENRAPTPGLKYYAGVIVFGVAYWALLTPAVVTAFTFAWDGEGLPYPLARVLKTLPRLFPQHMALGGLALASAPLAILTLRCRRLHKFFGSLAVAAILGASLTSIPVAIASTANGAAKLGFITQGALWFFCAGLGGALMHSPLARKKFLSRKSHRTLMNVVVILTLAPIILRLMTALALDYDWASFKTLYGWMAWVSWLAPLSIYFGFLGVQKYRRASSALSAHEAAR